MILWFFFHLKQCCAEQKFLDTSAQVEMAHTSASKIPDSNLPYLMIHTLSLQLKESDLRLKHRSLWPLKQRYISLLQNRLLPTFLYWVWKHLLYFWYGETSGPHLRLWLPGLEAFYNRTVPSRRSLRSPEICQTNEQCPCCLQTDNEGTEEKNHEICSRSEPGSNVSLESQSRAPFSGVINCKQIKMKHKHLDQSARRRKGHLTSRGRMGRESLRSSSSTTA